MTRSWSRIRRDERGVSLTELACAMGLISVAFALFAAVVGSTLREGGEISEQSTSQGEVRASIDRLAADLRQAYSGDDDVAPLSAISASQITFTSPDRKLPFHLRKLSYRVSSGQLQRAYAVSSDTDGYPWTIPTLGGWLTEFRSIVGSSIFTYYDAAGAVTTDPAAVERVVISVTVATKTSPNRQYTYRTSVTLRTPKVT